MNQKELTNIIIKNYDIGTLKTNSIKLFPKSANQVYYFETINNKITQNYVLKIYTFPHENLEQKFQILHHLKTKHKLPFITPINSKHKTSLIIHNNKQLTILPYIQGEEFKHNNISHLKLAANFLGNFHKKSILAISELKLNQDKIIIINPLNLTNIKQTINKLKSNQNQNVNLLTNLMPKILEELIYLEKTIKENKFQSNFNKNKTISLTHGDYWPEQLIINNNKLIAILDSDEISPNYSQIELISAIRKFSKVTKSNDFRGDFSHFDTKKIKTFTTEYKKQLSIKNIDLTKQEISFIFRKGVLEVILFFLTKIIQDSDNYWIDPLNDIFNQLIWYEKNEQEFIKNIIT